MRGRADHCLAWLCQWMVEELVISYTGLVCSLSVVDGSCHLMALLFPSNTHGLVALKVKHLRHIHTGILWSFSPIKLTGLYQHGDNFGCGGNCTFRLVIGWKLTPPMIQESETKDSCLSATCCVCCIGIGWLSSMSLLCTEDQLWHFCWKSWSCFSAKVEERPPLPFRSWL